MSEIWTNLLLPKALKSCPKSNKSPNLVTLDMSKWHSLFVHFCEICVAAFLNGAGLGRVLEKANKTFFGN